MSWLTELIQRDPDAAYEVLKKAPWRKRDKAADLGTAVHKATEAYMLGKPWPKLPAEVVPRMEQFKRFLDDYQPEILMTEASVYNRTKRYAGTLDVIGIIGGRRLLWDEKNTRSGIYPEVALQLSAYRHSEFIGLPDGSEAPMPEVDGGAALWLTDYHYEFLDIECGREVFKAFLFALENYRWMEVTSKGVIRGPVPLPHEPTQAELDLAKAVNE